MADIVFTTLATAADNTYLAAVYAKVSGEVSRVWTLVSDSDLITPARLMGVSDWSDIILRRDGAALEERTREYIQACSDQVARTLIRWPSVVTSEVVPIRRVRP